MYHTIFSPKNLNLAKNTLKKLPNPKLPFYPSHHQTLHNIKPSSLSYSISQETHFFKSPFSPLFPIYIKSPSFSRHFASLQPPSDGPPEWTGDITYLDESGDVIFSGKGIRSVDPGLDDHVMVGGLKKPFSSASAIAKIVEIVGRWKWGPEMENQLDRLHFVPNMSHVNRALQEIREVEALMGLFGWAKRQSWYDPVDEIYVLLFDRLNQNGDFDRIQTLFDDMIRDYGSRNLSGPFVAYNRVIQHLARAGKLEVSFCCFKKIQDSGCKIDTQTYNSLITLFLNKGLPYKAFEIYEAMEESACRLDDSTYELMIPSLAKSGRLDAAFKLFGEMKDTGLRPSFAIFASLVDSMGKAGRLDTSMKVYMEMQASGLRPSATMYVSLVESFVRAGKLDTAVRLWDEMKKSGFRPNFGLYTMIVESHAKSGKLEVAMSVFSDMEKAGFLPTPSTYSCLLDMHAASGQVDSAMKLYNSMTNAGLRPGLSTYTSLLTVLANKKLVDVAAKILLEMKAVGFPVDVNASDVLMIYIKDGSVDLALRWLRFMGASGIRTNNFIIRQLFESCMKNGLYESAKPLLEMYVGSAAKVDLILYTSILAHLVRCQEEQNERHIMSILNVTKHKAHSFMCGLFTGPEQRKKPVLSFVREFFQGIDYEMEEGAARYFVNVLLNYLVLMGQINRARCVWKVAYENKLFPKAIVFDQHIAWSLDVRSLSVGAALIAVIHTLHRFRKRMLYYGVVPRRIKLVTGPTLKIVVAQILSSVESPFEVSKVVLRSPGDSVLEWFKKPIVQQFLLNEIPSRADILMHKLNTLFPSSAPEIRSLSPPKPLLLSKVDFHDTGRGPRVPSMTDYFGFTMASLNESGSVFANPCKGEKNMSTLMYRPFSSWANNSEWSMRFEAEEVKVVALGTGWIAAITSLNFLRIFTEGGLQRYILSLDGPVVTAAGFKDELAVVIHASDYLSSGDQMLEFKVFNVSNGTQPIRGRLPLTPGSCLTWFGFREDGQLSSYDSKGVLRVFTNQYGGSWLPVFSASKERKSEEENYWIVGLNASKLFCIVCKSPDSYPLVTPKPVLTLLSLSFPLASSDLGADNLENEFIMNCLHLSQTQRKIEDMEAAGLDTMALDDEAFNMEAALDRCILRLIASCCNGDKLVRAMELARLLSLEKSLKGAIKLVTALKLPILAERFNGILEERLSGAVACPISASNASIGDKKHGCLPIAENHRASEPLIQLPPPRLPSPQFSKQEKSEEKVKIGGMETHKNSGHGNATEVSSQVQFQQPMNLFSKASNNDGKLKEKAKVGGEKTESNTTASAGCAKEDGNRIQFQRPTNPFVKASNNQEKSSLFDSLKKMKKVDDVGKNKGGK